MPFEFATAGRILFGAGSLNNLVDVLPKSAQSCIVVTGGGSVPIEALVQILDHVHHERAYSAGILPGLRALRGHGSIIPDGT